ncbi:unnamed protein product [Owenia fusiformis]|uniref:Uncharacterized protein n=1 Tax=Owenia fusiformis TaxID=6347 RepID=A0A8J1UXQ8_OWEFU|nr:unnamed protein product [Owenia fusiformis]
METIMEEKRAIRSSQKLWVILLLMLYGFKIQVKCEGLCKASDGEGNIALGSTIFINDIPEDYKNGTVLSVLNITGDNSEIELQITDISDPHIGFHPATRELVLLRPLERDGESGQSSISIKLSCRDLSAEQSMILISVIITIKDVNDSPPKFSEAEYSVNISELAPVGMTLIGSIEAKDADPDNSYITYSILPDTFSEYFDIPLPGKGIVTIAKALSYEKYQTMLITIMAKDNHPPVNGIDQSTLFNTANLTIHIQDGDNQNPAFNHNQYFAMVPDNITQGSLVTVKPEAIFARDQDIGINASVHYDITSDSIKGDAEYFSLDNITAELRVAKAPLEANRVYFVQIKATQVDDLDRYAIATLRVDVQGPNMNSPIFEQSMYNISVAEGLPIGDYVLRVQAIDSDKGDTVTYSFNDLTASKFFNIHPTSGEITTAQSLDYEQQKFHTFTVKATDSQYTTSSVVNVRVTDVNDNPPVFQQDTYIFEGVKEDDHVIGKVKATDQEVGSMITYSKVGEDEFFKIDPTSGVISLRGNISAIVMEQYNLFIRATDLGVPPIDSYCTVIITFPPVPFPTPQTILSIKKQTDLILVIVLSAFLGVMAIIIVGLIIYIMTRPKHINSKIKVGKESPSKDNLEGLFYMQSPGSMQLDFYGGQDATTIQENPLQESDDYTVDSNKNPVYTSTSFHGSQNGDLHHKQNGSFQADRHLGEIQLETAVVPKDDDSLNKPNGSINTSTSESISGSIPNIHRQNGVIHNSMERVQEEKPEIKVYF